MRWFDSLVKGSIHSFEELTRDFGARFLTCSRVPKPLDSLLSMSMREGETLKTYFNRFYNEIDGDFKDVATFKDDKLGTIQPHDDALVVTVQISGYDVKRAMIDQGSGADIMYPDLFKGSMGAPPSQEGGSTVSMDIIVVDAFSSYTTILARPWLHAMGVVASMLHVNVKYITNGRVVELVGCQSTTRQCMVASVNHHIVELRSSEAGAIKEVFYLEWLANTVVVKKKSGKWRVCVDFTDLNKACPKAPFSIPRIDQLVDVTFGHSRMSFLDAFQGYHQIPWALSNQEKTAFLIPTGNFHYRVMPFGLKNAGSTYQKMVTRMFESRLGRNMGACIDDMVVKSKEETEHLLDLDDIFAILRRHKLHLNASK
ncbi:uncharacterized protein LOC142625005 [Castanea sativa]|uniref:uncharacterized protein LOC142625005 n=1 Tax=Castanea sativa TaxID=21020 RepID=UPI003F64B4A2